MNNFRTTILPGASDTTEFHCCPVPLLEVNARRNLAGIEPDGNMVSAVIAWCVFMICSIFTQVNIQYWKPLVIYPDFASDFAAILTIATTPLTKTLMQIRVQGYHKTKIYIHSPQLTIVN